MSCKSCKEKKERNAQVFINTIGGKIVFYLLTTSLVAYIDIFTNIPIFTILFAWFFAQGLFGKEIKQIQKKIKGIFRKRKVLNEEN